MFTRLQEPLLHPVTTPVATPFEVEIVRAGGLGVLAPSLATFDTWPGALIVIVHVLVPLEYP